MDEGDRGGEKEERKKEEEKREGEGKGVDGECENER